LLEEYKGQIATYHKRNVFHFYQQRALSPAVKAGFLFRHSVDGLFMNQHMPDAFVIQYTGMCYGQLGVFGKHELIFLTIVFSYLPAIESLRKRSMPSLQVLLDTPFLMYTLLLLNSYSVA
jgi:hypothetical protein